MKLLIGTLLGSIVTILWFLLGILKLGFIIVPAGLLSAVLLTLVTKEVVDYWNK